MSGRVDLTSSYDFDYFVIGAGSGGVRSARIAAGYGARVAVAEDRHLGGTCVNVGCVPKKLLVYAAHFAQDFEDAAGFGWSVGPTRHDWARLIANKNAEIQRLNGVYRRLLEGAGVTIVEGRARLVDAHTVAVGEERYTADKILIATGGWPELPDIPGAREHGITSNEAFYLERLPGRILIVGGGYIGVEFAGIFHGLGSRVSLSYRGPLFLRGFDQDVREALAEEMARSGVELLFKTTVERVEKAGDCLLAHMSDGQVIETDAVMFATGRKPNTDGLGLEEAGVRVDAAGAVIIDEDYRTTAANIYAVGDVTNRIALTPVAIAEGHALADTLFGNNPRRIDYENIPTAVFSLPPIGTVGLTEEEARRTLAGVDIYTSSFRPMRHTLSGRQEKTLMKLVVDRADGRVVGCHMVGPDAPEIIQGLAVAMVAGATKADFDRTMGIHPTAAEEFVTMRTKAPDPVPQDEVTDEAAQ